MAASLVSNLKILYQRQTIKLFQKDFLRTWDKNNDEIKSILLIEQILQSLSYSNISFAPFSSGLAVSNFRDKSTRTRFSFAGAINMLGLALQDLDETKSQVSHGETTRETAVMVAFQAEVIGIRDDLFLGEGHKYQLEVAQALDQAYGSCILRQRPTIINLQCDEDHPTQSLSDLAHILTHFQCTLDDLRGKKLAMTWAYSPAYGKPLSVPQGVIALLTRFGMHVTLAHPPQYELLEEVLSLAKFNAQQSGGSFTVCSSITEAFQGADIVYPKSWAPHVIMKKRTELFHSKGKPDEVNSQLGKLEEECLQLNALHKDWECNDELMKHTKGGKALYMHCLPADISGVNCPKGEVSETVFDRYRDDTYREASHKPFIIAAMILAAKFENLPCLFDTVLKRNAPRVLQF